jgi:DNA-binding XRE family transcriptional regulator
MDTDLVILRLRITNNKLMQLRKNNNYTLPKFAKLIHMRETRYRLIENLKIHPKEDEMINICVALNTPIDDVFPESLLAAIDRGAFPAKRKRMLSEDVVKSLPSGNGFPLLTNGGIDEVEEKIDTELLHDQESRILSTLPGREGRILKRLVGFDGEEPETEAEVARDFGCTRTNVNAFKHRALKRLRHPSRLRWLKPFLVPSESTEKPVMRRLALKYHPLMDKPVEITKVTEIKHRKCVLCDYIQLSNVGFEGHMREYHPEYKFTITIYTNGYSQRVYKCGTCGVTVGGWKGLIKHYDNNLHKSAGLRPQVMTEEYTALKNETERKIGDIVQLKDTKEIVRIINIDHGAYVVESVSSWIKQLWKNMIGDW